MKNSQYTACAVIALIKLIRVGASPDAKPVAPQPRLPIRIIRWASEGKEVRLSVSSSPALCCEVSAASLIHQAAFVLGIPPKYWSARTQNELLHPLTMAACHLLGTKHPGPCMVWQLDFLGFRRFCTSELWKGSLPFTRATFPCECTRACYALASCTIRTMLPLTWRFQLTPQLHKWSQSRRGVSVRRFAPLASEVNWCRLMLLGNLRDASDAPVAAFIQSLSALLLSLFLVYFWPG